jgi:protein ImuB
MRVATFYFTQELDLEAFAQACIRFSPQISVLKPNVIFIEIGKCLTLYSEQSFIARAGVLLRRFKTEARIRITSDIPSSLALARYDASSVSELPLESLTEFGDPFRSDEVGRKTIEKMTTALSRLGLKTVADFSKIAASQLPSRFGGISLFCRQRIEGAESLPWPHWQPPETYVEERELLPAEYCAELEPLLFKSKEMLDRIFSRLRGKCLKAETLALTLELERYSTVKNPSRQWSFELISPQSSSAGFLPILKERLSWDLQKEPIESYVIAMKCEVTRAVLSTDSQRNFFHNRDDFAEAMGSLFGQLEEYLGPGHVFWAQVTEDRLPEMSWIQTQGGDSPYVTLQGRYPLRPTRVFKAPVPITVIEDRISLKGRVYKTLKWSKPERLSLDWLDDTPARNYYRVELEQGRAFWVFSDPTHHFFLHGYFE